jgi:hypothetical protein
MIVSHGDGAYISWRRNSLSQHSCFNHHIQLAQRLSDQTILSLIITFHFKTVTLTWNINSVLPILHPKFPLTNYIPIMQSRSKSLW